MSAGSSSSRSGVPASSLDSLTKVVPRGARESESSSLVWTRKKLGPGEQRPNITWERSRKQSAPNRCLKRGLLIKTIDCHT